MTKVVPVRLADICTINPRLPRDHGLTDETTVSFVPMAAVDETFGEIAVQAERVFCEVKRGYTHFRNNDVLFAKITPCMQNGKAAIARELRNGIGFGSTEFHVLRHGNSVLPEWLFYFIRQDSFREQAKRSFTGTAGQQRVPAPFLEKASIPLPPLAEQRRIVDVLSRAEGIVRLRREAQEKAQALIPAIFLDLFGDPAINPKHWPVVPLGEVAEIGSGAGFPIADQGKPNGAFPFYKVSDMNTPGNETSMKAAHHYIDEPTRRRLRAVAFPVGATIFPKIGAAIATNKKRVLTVPSCIDNNVMAVTPRAHMESAYLHVLMQQIDLSDFASDSNPPSIRKSTVQAWPVPLPPIDSQRAFAAKAAAAHGIIKLQATSAAVAQATFDALLHRAFA